MESAASPRFARLPERQPYTCSTCPGRCRLPDFLTAGEDVDATRRYRQPGLAAALLLSGGAQAAGDSAGGKAIFARTCQNCHSTDIGVNKIGPSLYNIVGRQSASIPDYNYSAAMKGANRYWTEAEPIVPLQPSQYDAWGQDVFQGSAQPERPGRRDRLFAVAAISRALAHRTIGSRSKGATVAGRAARSKQNQTLIRFRDRSGHSTGVICA